MALRGVHCPISMQAALVSTPRAAAPKSRAPAPRVRPHSTNHNRGKAIARSSTSSSSSPLAGLLSFLKGKPDPSSPPPGITFLSGRGREAIKDPSEVASLWRSSGFDSPCPPSSGHPASSPRPLSELTTGLPISGSDEERVARGIRYTWRLVAAFADSDENDDGSGEEGEEEEAGGGGVSVGGVGGVGGDDDAETPRRRRRKKRLVGLARLLSDGSFAAHLSDVVVHPEFRNRGIGRALVAAAIAEAHREPGPASSVVSWARPGRPRLFLQRCGFRVSVAYRVLRYEGDLLG